MSDSLQIHIGDCREVLRTLPEGSVQCCVTSPPYWGLRSYGVGTENGELGLEPTPEQYVANMVGVFREVRRVLRDDGTLWMNLGDSYARNGGTQGGGNREMLHMEGRQKRMLRIPDGTGLKPKDMVGMPWRVAFALQADGWYLRSDIIWHKPNPMPESIQDRPTKSHEYIFLLTKSAQYFYDHEAIKEQASPGTHARSASGMGRGRTNDVPHGWEQSPHFHGAMPGTRKRKLATNGSGTKNNESFDEAMAVMPDRRNKRTVWTVPSAAYSGAHFATYPPDLIKPCILAGSRPGDVVLDPFGGSGTTGQVALELGRRAILIELNPEYGKLIEQRTNITPGLALA